MFVYYIRNKLTATLHNNTVLLVMMHKQPDIRSEGIFISGVAGYLHSKYIYKSPDSNKEFIKIITYQNFSKIERKKLLVDNNKSINVIYDKNNDNIVCTVDRFGNRFTYEQEDIDKWGEKKLWFDIHVSTNAEPTVHEIIIRIPASF